MRYMILVRATPQTEAEVTPDPDPQLLADMADYHEALARAGVLLDGAGLRPSRDGWRLHYAGGDPAAPTPPTVVDGPYAEAKELIAGYTLIQVASPEEALEWSRRYPNPNGRGQPAVVEVRRLYELDDFAPGEAIDRMRRMENPSPAG